MNNSPRNVMRTLRRATNTALQRAGVALVWEVLQRAASLRKENEAKVVAKLSTFALWDGLSVAVRAALTQMTSGAVEG